VAAAAAAADDDDHLPPPAPPAAASAVLPLPFIPTRGAPDDPLVRPPLVLNRRLRAHPLDALAAALAAAANRLFGQPLALAVDRHASAVALLCLSAAALAALGVSSAGDALRAALPTWLGGDGGLGLPMAVPAWLRRVVFLASETGGAAELPWMGLAAVVLSAPLAAWAVGRCWWLGSTDACYTCLLQLQKLRQGGELQQAEEPEDEGGAGARLLLAWLATAARLALLSSAAGALGGAAATASSSFAACWPAALLLVAVAAAPVVACVALSLRGRGSTTPTTTTTTTTTIAAALALLGLEASWLALRASQAVQAAASSPLVLQTLAPPVPPPSLAVCLPLALALATSLWVVHKTAVRARVDAARAAPGDALRLHLTARLGWDGFGAGAAFDGTGRKGLGWDLDDPDRPSVPVVVQLAGGGREGAASSASAGAAAAGGGAAEDGALLLRADEAARAKDGAAPLTPAARLAPFGPVLARALRGALPGERLVVRARVASASTASGAAAAAAAAAANAVTTNPAAVPTVQYFHPGLEALLTLAEARLLVYGRDLARSDPDVQPGDGMLLPVGGDGTGPRGAFQGLDGEIGATGRVPGVVVAVGRAGVRASGNAVLNGRVVELEVRVDAVLRRGRRRRRSGGDGDHEATGAAGAEQASAPRATMMLA
jgi:hypothetical protein